MLMHHRNFLNSLTYGPGSLTEETLARLDGFQDKITQ